MMPQPSSDAASLPSPKLWRRGDGLSLAWVLGWVLLGWLTLPASGLAAVPGASLATLPASGLAAVPGASAEAAAEARGRAAPEARARSTPDSTGTSAAQSSPEMDTPPYPFTPAHLGRVWGHAGDRDLLLGLGVGTAAALLIWPLDDEISDWFYEEEPLGSGAYELGRDMGHRKYVAWVSLGLAGGGLLLGNDHIRDTGALYLEANLITAGFTQLFKFITQRERPDGSNHHSFPSGHASATMASARVLQMRFGWWVGAPAYAAATFVGLSRIQGKKHYPSDVIFGWAVGFYVASTVVRATEARPAGGAGEGEEAAKGTQLSWLPPPSFSDPGLPLVHLSF